MRVRSTKINGLLIIDGLRFDDSRGALIKPFSKDFICKSRVHFNTNFKEVWFTKSHKNVIRAMHVQMGPMSCEKLVSVVKGKVLDVILDIRPESKTYGEYFSIVLEDSDTKSLYIPKGCAHGYKVLEDDTLTLYMATEVHDSQNDIGYKWNSFGFDWEIVDPIISERDEELPPFIL